MEAFVDKLALPWPDLTPVTELRVYRRNVGAWRSMPRPGGGDDVTVTAKQHKRGEQHGQR